MKMPHWPDPNKIFDIELGLDRVFEAVEKLGNPHKKLPKTIHFAGTNGKGSTIAFTKAILKAHGKKVHVYTSPHLIDFNERIELVDKNGNGEYIDDDFLFEMLEEVRTKTIDIKLTFFEATTIAAFLAFSKIEADYLLLETGLGGRLDATNVLENVEACVITRIARDHEEFLGNSLEKIASEKAGIIKQKSVVFSSHQEDIVFDVLKESAKKHDAILKILNRDFQEIDFEKHDIKLGLKGNHQNENANIAFELCKNILHDFNIDIAKVSLAKANWRARLQDISDSRLGNILDNSSELILDGCHNRNGVEALAEFLKTESKTKDNIIILGILKNRNPVDFFEVLKPVASKFLTVNFNSMLKFDAHEMAKIGVKKGLDCLAFDNIENALHSISDKQNCRVVICGSLYLAGEVLEKIS